MTLNDLSISWQTAWSCNDKCREEITLWTHNKHSLLWEFGRKMTMLWRGLIVRCPSLFLPLLRASSMSSLISRNRAISFCSWSSFTSEAWRSSSRSIDVRFDRGSVRCLRSKQGAYKGERSSCYKSLSIIHFSLEPMELLQYFTQ